MATAQSTQTAAGESNSENRYQQAINGVLVRTASLLKTADFFSGVLLLVCWLLGFMLLVAVVDAWVWPLNPLMRLSALVVLASGIVYLSARWMLPLLLSRINPMYAAKVIEEGHPALKNSLLNYVSLVSRKDELPIRKGVLEAVSRRAAIDARNIPSEQSIDYGQVIKVMYLLTGILALFAAYLVFSPRSPLPTFWRLLAPLSNVAPPTRVSITEIDPQFGSVFLGDPIEITAIVTGLVNDEKAVVVYDTVDNQSVGAVSAMLRIENDLNRFRCQLPTGRDGVQKDLTYRIHAGDAVSDAFQIRIAQRPTIILDKIDLQFPSYTLTQNKTLVGQGDLQVIQGTKVKFFGHSNTSMQKAWIELYDIPPGQPVASSMTQRMIRSTVQLTLATDKVGGDPALEVKDSLATGGLTTTLDGQGKPRYTHYRLRMLDLNGKSDRLGPLYRIEVRTDQPPEVKFTWPQSMDNRLTLDQQLEIRFDAIDADYQLTRLVLNASSRSGQSVSSEVDLGTNDGKGLVSGSWTLDPKQMSLVAGDEVTVFVQAEDNRHTAPLFSLDPNIVRTQNMRIKIEESANAAPVDAKKEPGDDKGDDRVEQPENDPNAKDPKNDENDPSKPQANRRPLNDDSSAAKNDLEKPKSNNQEGDSSDPNSQEANDDSNDQSRNKPNQNSRDPDSDTPSAKPENSESKPDKQTGEGDSAEANPDPKKGPENKPNEGKQDGSKEEQAGARSGQPEQEMDGSNEPPNRKEDSKQDNAGDRSAENGTEDSQGSQAEPSQPDRSSDGSDPNPSQKEVDELKKSWEQSGGEAPDQPKHDGDVMDKIRQFMEKQDQQQDQPQDGQPQDSQPQDSQPQDGQPQDSQPQDSQPQPGPPAQGLSPQD